MLASLKILEGYNFILKISFYFICDYHIGRKSCSKYLWPRTRHLGGVSGVDPTHFQLLVIHYYLFKLWSDQDIQRSDNQNIKPLSNPILWIHELKSTLDMDI